MILTDDMYVPALRWRQGEYQALLRLSATAKRRVVPFITIPEIEFDFEEWRPKKSLQEHVHPFAARYKTKWNQNPAWIGVHANIADQRMDDGRDVLAYTFENLRTFQANGVPALPLGASPRHCLFCESHHRRRWVGRRHLNPVGGPYEAKPESKD